jgi:L-threonylcarbamoyladenylate synthase
MKTIPVRKIEDDPKLAAEISAVLEGGGLVCLPCGASYRIVADLTSAEAVTRLLQSKRRTQKAPSLVFVQDQKMLAMVTAEICPLRRKLMSAFWPGPLTIRFQANPELPERVVKPLIKANGKLGVRIPDHALLGGVLRAFGRPLLVSSANPESRKGSSSPAQVRKNFLGRVDLLVDAGDLPQVPASTVVDVVDGAIAVTRPGAISQEQIEQALKG